jgi:nucleoside-diphosphate-sugar epimerase
MKQRPLILFGATGRLGLAVAEAATRLGISVDKIHWLEAKSWKGSNLRTIRARVATTEDGADVLFAGGVTDPNAPELDLIFGNIEMPIRVIEATARDPKYRYLTFGSVLETFAELTANNRYLASKAALWKRLRSLAAEPLLSSRVMHLRFHTLYGGSPSPHSFLGQIYESLRSRRPFAMSEGRQIREYAHVEDAARSIFALLGRDWQGKFVYDLSTGKPIALGELALSIFRSFDCMELLHMGALPTPGGENEDVRFARSPGWLLGQPRDPVEGICGWLASLLRLSGRSELSDRSGRRPL